MLTDELANTNVCNHFELGGGTLHAGPRLVE